MLKIRVPIMFESGRSSYFILFFTNCLVSCWTIPVKVCTQTRLEQNVKDDGYGQKRGLKESS